MKILFVSSTFPIPPRNGMEVSLSNLMEGLSSRHEIYFGLIPDQDNNSEDELERCRHLPTWLKKKFLFVPLRKSIVKEILGELCIVEPYYFRSRYDLRQVKAELGGQLFDAIWASPDGLGGFCDFYKKEISTNVTTVLGINEPYYTVYVNMVRLLIRNRVDYSLRFFAQIIRFPFIYFNEKKYLKRYDILNVQTNLEKQRVVGMLGDIPLPRVMVAPNGIKEKLLQVVYSRPEKNKILFMASLTGGRARETVWFIRTVWPRILKKNINAELLIVGSPAPKELFDELSAIPGVSLLGFVDDLVSVFSQVTISIMPVIQHHGIIDRILDSLAAGIPVVGFRDPMKTIDGLIDNVHGLVAQNEPDLVDKVTALLSDDEKLYSLSKNGRELAIEHPSWSDTVKIVEQNLSEVKGVACQV